MEPRIQYAQTSDGVSIAFRTLGEGMPYVWMMGAVVSNLQLGWQIPYMRELFEAWAARWKVVWYDRRGSGLSQRDVTDFSLDALLADVEAVVDHLGLEKFVVHGSLLMGPMAIAYAARHPDKVSHLVLADTYATGSDFWKLPRMRGFIAMREVDWDTYVEALAHMYSPDPAIGAAFIRESTTAEAQKAFVDATEEHDVTALLPEVRCPTLVLYSPGVRPLLLDVGIDTVRRLAAGIPGASLVVSESFDATLQAIEEFMGVGAQAAVAPAEAGGFRTVLFTDVEGSTALTQRLGDAKARELLREHERIVREALAAHGGSEVKTMGDGFMASFGSATKALECAVAMQRAFEARNAGVGAQGLAPLPEPIRVRIGLNAGEPVAEEGPDGRGDLFGTAVNLAARIAAQAQGGEILVSNVVRELVAGKGFLFSDREDAVLRGFEDPVRLYEVRWREEPVEGQA